MSIDADERLKAAVASAPAPTASGRTRSRGSPLGTDAWRSTLSALSERDYAWFFVGNTAFFMAMQMNMILRGWLALELTDAATAIGIVSLGSAVPMLVVSPFGGVLADRVNKRSLLLVMQSLVAGMNLIVAVLILGGWIEFWQLTVAAFGTGSVMAIVMPARQALVPQLVPQHKLMNAVSLQMAGMNLTRIVGPAVAGLLIAPLGVGWVYVLTVALFVIATLSLLPLPVHGMVASRRHEPFVQNLLGGFDFVAQSPLFRSLLLLALMMPLFALPVQQMLPVFTEKVYGLEPWALGVLMASTGVGGLAGALLSTNLDSDPRKGRIMLVGGLVMGVCFVAFALTPWFLLALVLLLVGNAGRMLFMVTNNTVIQARVPDELRGRVMALVMMSFGTMPLGILPVAVAADTIGAPAAIAISSGLMLALLVTFFSVSRVLRNLRVEMLDRSELSPAQAAKLVAEGRLQPEEAETLSGRATG